MHILICHERFLFRFGADRVLILLGKGFKELGHTVTVMANRYDSDVVASFASRAIDCPSDGVPYLDLNEFTSQWLERNWSELFDPENVPDVVIVGGWPFISATSFFRDVCRRVIFIDFGVVPADGYSEGMKVTLDKLHALRRRHLQNASLIVALSNFIAESQSRPDSHHRTPVRSILLGANHMDMAVWPADRPEGSAMNLVRSLKLRGSNVMLCLGRWETGCYKNSQAGLEFMQSLIASRPDCTLLVLEEASRIEIPPSLKEAVIPIGFPDDRELNEIMRCVDLGLSFSLWEGFNLPLAEMQWLGRPALAFNLGAHPEVIAHPWYLCTNIEEMSVKAKVLLAGEGPDRSTVAESLDKFRSYFQWERVVNEYSDLLCRADDREREEVRPSGSPLFIDVTNSTRDPANSGVVRVARRLSRALQEAGHDPLFVLWDQTSMEYVLPTQAEHERLSAFNGPFIKNASRLSISVEQRTSLDDILNVKKAPEGWLLLAEVTYETSFRPIRKFARERGLRIAAIFYDSIPILRPDLCNEHIRTNHGQYMQALGECDLVLPISNFSARCLEEFWCERNVKTSCRVVPDVLPGEFGGIRRRDILSDYQQGKADILCVSTLEPRKNHRNLIQACLSMAERHPELDWSLTLVGNRYIGSFEIADWIQEVAATNPRIKWRGIVDDATLNQLYEECLFTVYPSILEGFGLPIVESIWHGRPCICYNQGVMAELADEGGCLTTDVTDPLQLCEAIYQMATDDDLRLRLARQATIRPLKKWEDYVAELSQAIAECSTAEKASRISLAATMTANKKYSLTSWQSALYPDCICENWQMNDSERMAVTGLLARHKPHCSIEVGTYHGGSLSLISQFSKMVFSIDIDETIPSRLSFPNVRFLTGRSNIMLPHLFSELDNGGIPVEFMLIDGDHSAQGVKNDIGCLLQYVPKSPLLVLLHDSFNPECRRGMLEAGWERSRYCHWVDIDFVPGRIVEHPGTSHGELWGGLAAAFFLPVARVGDLQVNRTSEEMFRVLSSSRTVVAGARS